MNNQRHNSEEQLKALFQEEESNDFANIEEVKKRLLFITQAMDQFESKPSSGHCLLITGNNAEPICFPLDKDIVNIGRSPKADLTLKGDGISRFHCRLEKNIDDWLLTDLDSKNGLKINDKKTLKRILCDGDLVKIGSFTIIFTK